MRVEITFTSRITLLPESSDLLKYGMDVRVTEVSFSHCPGSCREWFFDSFLAITLPQRGAELVRHLLTWATQIFLLEDNLRQKDDTWRLCEPPKDTFLPNYSSQKIQFIQSTFPASLVCTAAIEKHFLCFLVADFAQGNLAPQLHHSWPWSTADQTACPPCTLPQGCTSKAWMGKRRHSAGIRADLEQKSFLAPDTVGVTRTAKETGFSFLPVAVSWF